MTTDNAVDQVIADVAKSQPADEKVDAKTADTEKPADKPDEADEQVKAQEEAFSRKAINALSKRDKRIGRLEAELAARTAEIERLAQQSQQRGRGQSSHDPDEPNPDDYDEYGDYIEARLEYKMNKQLNERNEKQRAESTTSQADARRDAWVEDRLATGAKLAPDNAAKIPDYTKVIEENGDVFDSLPNKITEAILQTENLGLTMYSLAKDGTLYELNGMSEAQALMAIGKAEARASTYLTQKPTNAPAPMSGNKGTGRSGPTPETMSADDLLAAIRR